MRAKAPAMRLVMIIQPSCRIGSKLPHQELKPGLPAREPDPSIVAKKP
jgi:hypothetical protein